MCHKVDTVAYMAAGLGEVEILEPAQAAKWRAPNGEPRTAQQVLAEMLDEWPVEMGLMGQ